MADKRFQDYTDLGVAPAAGDFLLVRDVSDTTDSAVGTLKEITVANLRAAIVPILTADITDANVTFAKLQDASGASKLLGRGDSGAGDFEEITLGAGLAMTGTVLSAAGAGLPTDDTNPLVQDPVDTTKRTRIDTGAVATATTRAIIMGDRDVDLSSAGTFAEKVHTHAATDLVSGTLVDARVAATNVTQHQAALAITAAQITGNLTLAQLPQIASPTVLGNVTGGSAVPAAISPADFKTEFGFGGLADLDFVTVSDISAGGTPSSSTFLRGDGSWAATVPSVGYDVEDLTDGTTLTAAHSRYQVTGGALAVTQLRLRHASDQTLPVRVILEDSDTVTTGGAEFTLIQADDQTGLCVVRAETNGSINGRAFATTAVADAAWTGSSGTTTTITSAGSNLPVLAAGDIFEVRDHSTADNNGFYRATGTPATNSVTATKLSGANPANAAAEPINIDTGFIALAGPRASTVVVIDANPEATPNSRLEGETLESRSVRGDSDFLEILKVSGSLDVDSASDFSQPITLSGSAAVIGGGKVVSNIELTDTAEGFLDAGNKNGAATFDYTQGAWQKCIATGNISSVSISNPPATGRVGTLTLEIHQDGTGSRTIAWGAAYRFPGGTDYILSTGAGDIDIFTLSTRDGGTTWYVFEGGKDWAA